MSKQINKYVANTGIDFEQFKPPIRVEKNDPIPARVSATDIKELLDADLIREISEGADE